MATKMTTLIVNELTNEKAPFSQERLTDFISETGKDFKELDLHTYTERAVQSMEGRTVCSASQVTNLLILEGLSNISELQPEWTYFCARIYLKSFIKKLHSTENQGRHLPVTDQNPYGKRHLQQTSS